MADPQLQDQQPPPGLSFPTDPSEFDSDDRISFSRLDNKFIAVQDDGTEFEFDNQLKRWIPTLDEELIRQQQSAYGGPDVDDDDDHDRGGGGPLQAQKSTRLPLGELVCVTKEEAAVHMREVVLGDREPEDLYDAEVVERVEARLKEAARYEKYR